jgi:ferritin-like metal-binding protein YciE
MVTNLEDGFLAELADMLFAERELLKVLPKLSQAASSRRLRDALEWHAEQTEQQVMRLQNVYKLFGRKEETETCEGMQGILEECKDLLQKTGPGPVRDAMIIAATQKAEHYEIAAYGTLCSWADQLGEDQVVDMLAESLHEKKAADRNLSRIAEMNANPQAEHGGRGDRFGFDREPQGRGRQEGRESYAMSDRTPRFEDRSRGRSGREKRYED